MKHPLCGRYSLTVLLRITLYCVVCLVWTAPMTAQTGPPTVLFVGHLNTDCYADTVLGSANGPRTYLPDVIIWGKRDEAHPQPCDKDVTGGHAPGTRIMPKTPLVYPNWREMRGSVAFEQYNTNDSIADVILYLWGKSPATGKDTSRALVIYGQLALDTLPVLLVGEIDSLQTAPFFAMDMRIGREFVAPDVRDISGQISYELPRAKFPPKDGDEEPPHPIIQASATKESATVSVYPNPAELWTRLESSPLEEGEYTITVMAVNGRVYHTQTVQVAARGQIERELHLTDLPSGYYVVRLHREGELLSSYPIVIVR
jgi:hypothetical protein